MNIKAGPGIKITQVGHNYTISNSRKESTSVSSGGDTRWQPITFSSNTSGTFLVEETEASLPEGAPIRWLESPATVYYYGAIQSAVNNGTQTTYTFAGPSAATMTALDWDTFRLSTMVHLFVSGEYGTNTGTDLLWDLKSIKFKWLGCTSFLVNIEATQGTNATTTQPIINVSIDDNNISTNGIQMVSSSFVSTTSNDINSAKYTAFYNSIIKIACTTACTGATKSEDLSLELLFVSE